MEKIDKSNLEWPDQPTTIEEFKQWYEAQGLPSEEVTRFFIGKNITAPKAFGIYKNAQGEYVVYKNKANGERAIRYQGSDEAYAVGELFLRLKDEIANQRSKNGFSTGAQPFLNNVLGSFGTKKVRVFIGGILLAIAACIGGALYDDGIPDGYYQYQGEYYYNYGRSWYYYDKRVPDWYESSTVKGVITKENYDQYHTSTFLGKRFEDSDEYKKHNNNDGDNDSGWDSNDTDWDSDW